MLKFAWAGTNEWAADLGRLGKDLSFDMWKQVGREIIDDFHDAEARLINSEGATGKHKKWDPLTEKYAAWKRKHYPASPIMMLTGSLFLSLLGRHPDSIQSVVTLPTGGAVIRMGTAVTSKDGFDYPTAHQRGPEGHKATGKLPARRTIDPTDARMKIWFQIIQRHIVQSAMRNKKTFDHVSLGGGSFDQVGDSAVDVKEYGTRT